MCSAAAINKRSCSSSISEVEQMGQQLGKLVAYIATVCLGAEDLNVVRKLGQELTACAAGGRPVFAVGEDGEALEFSVAFAYSLDTGGTLCADGTAECSVLNVAAGEHAAVGTFKSGAYGETGIGDVCIEGSLLGFG